MGDVYYCTTVTAHGAGTNLGELTLETDLNFWDLSGIQLTYFALRPPFREFVTLTLATVNCKSISKQL